MIDVVIKDKNKIPINPAYRKLKYYIDDHTDFEIFETPNGKEVKVVEGAFYSAELSDLDIILLTLKKLESKIRILKTQKADAGVFKSVRIKIKQYYKMAIRLLAPTYANGWNRWSDNILDLYLNDHTNKILWGSGNCGKSAVMACILYTAWRINPTGRTVILASRVEKESTQRVFGYITGIHKASPLSAGLSFKHRKGDNAIYCQLPDKHNNNKLTDDVRACIISLPVKARANDDDLGSNLMGKHPSDKLIVCFDEGQEIEARLMHSKIYLNWKTNNNLQIVAWGNPSKVSFTDISKQNLIYRLATLGLSKSELKSWETQRNYTFFKERGDNLLLHLSMLDSPKDDPEEKEAIIEDENGVPMQRLWFLAGKDVAESIAKEGNSENSEAWYAQVLGFPVIDYSMGVIDSIVSSVMIEESERYPLQWEDPDRCVYYMGFDPSYTGASDYAAVSIIKVGLMLDGRVGVDCMGGKLNFKVEQENENESFIDKCWDKIYQASVRLKIPLDKIAVEIHSNGHLPKYSLDRHFEAGKWANDLQAGKKIYVLNPSRAVTELPLFREYGQLEPARDICYNTVSEINMAIRCAILSKQLFNIPEIVKQQLYNRKLNTTATKIKIESKKELRARHIQSPNDLDALAIAFDSLRKRGIFQYSFVSGGSYVEVLGDTYRNTKKEMAYKKRMGFVAQAFGVTSWLEDHGILKKTKPTAPKYRGV